MRNLEVTKVVKIRASFTKDEWEMYDTAYCPIVIARELNEELELCINTRGFTKLGTRHRMLTVMERYEDAGLLDTEPRAFLESILNVIYGEDNELGEPL